LANPSRRVVPVARPRPFPTNLRPWDPPAATLWAMDKVDLPPEPADALAVLDEQIDDERRRQERLVFGAAPVYGDEQDALIWHLPADRGMAAEIARGLAVLGLRVEFDGACAADRSWWVERALRANVVVLLFTPALRNWAAQPLAAAYEELTRRTEAVGRRVRWLPVVISATDVAGTPAGIPEHLCSFDWHYWDRSGRAARRKCLHALLGGILVDRTRF
jgi:hypothetical protein